MNVVSINSVFYGSTGKIMMNVAKLSNEQSINHFTFSGYTKKSFSYVHHSLVGGVFSKSCDIFLSFIFGNEGSYSYFSTKKLIKKLDKIKPAIIHIHNLHNNYLNYKLFFSYINKNNIPVVLTMHDCWCVTGHCPHFTFEKCQKWKDGCYDCPRYKLYPSSMLDNSKKMWKRKNKLFSDVKKLIIVTPSQWLHEIVSKSYLGNRNILTINNGIDLTIFKPYESEFRKKHNIHNKYIILGVAFDWGMRKGFDVFVELSKRLPEKYQIILVGTNDIVDKQLPNNIISIHRTNNQRELAEIYSSSDVFFNPTREENYPTVNMEALACGCPVITFNTGGSPEIIDEKTGIVVPVDDIDESIKAIINVCENKKISRNNCVERSKTFDMNKRFQEYVDLYKKVASENTLNEVKK